MMAVTLKTVSSSLFTILKIRFFFFFCTNGIIYYCQFLPISVHLYVIFSESTFNLLQLSTCTPFFLFVFLFFSKIMTLAVSPWYLWQLQPGTKQTEGFRAKLYVDWQSMTRSCSLRFLPMCLITGWATNTLLRVWVLVCSGPLLKCNGEWYSAKQHVFTEASYEISARID